MAAHVSCASQVLVHDKAAPAIVYLPSCHLQLCTGMLACCRATCCCHCGCLLRVDCVKSAHGTCACAMGLAASWLMWQWSNWSCYRTA
jgi:hypothetical protein